MNDQAKAHCLSRFPAALKRAPASYFGPPRDPQSELTVPSGRSCPFRDGFAGRLTQSGFIYNGDSFQLKYDAVTAQLVDDDTLKRAAESSVRDWQLLEDALEKLARIESLCAIGEALDEFWGWRIFPLLVHSDRFNNETKWTAYELQELLRPNVEANDDDDAVNSMPLKDCIGVGIDDVADEHWDRIYQHDDGTWGCEICEDEDCCEERQCQLLWKPLTQLLSEMGVQDVHWVAVDHDHPTFVGGLLPGGYLCGAFIYAENYYWSF
ncbi:hypothetical protein DYB32_009504 [Aphanomyces invadans]|uniref:Uncharacterized protein n=1 Tax=Aphanomyces invadans TaxID=157072 RepID=A0A3R6ZIE9_9STRA|nr:hypothetical protein DYB32_009504 [Aphanomyces invadans]